MSHLLGYENQLYSDMFNTDGLLIMAEGLGIERVFTNFIKLYSDPSHLVMILNTHDSEEQFFIKKLKENKEDLEILPPVKITTDTMSLNERTEAYMKGGCFFVTSRILVVDMLCDRVPIDLISGILVYNAHTIIDSCQETFILRMYRQKNKVSF